MINPRYTGGPLSRQRWLVIASVALFAFGASCTPASDERPLPGRPPVIDVTMDEYTFKYPPRVPAGRVIFRVRNSGRLPHRLSVLPLPEDLPPIDEQLHGPNRLTVTPFAGIPTRKPGIPGTFAVDFVAGRRYAFICFVRDPDGQSHALKGMNSEFRPVGPRGTTDGRDAED